MNFKISIVSALYFVLASFSFANAQAKSCPLDLSVVQYQENADIDVKLISDASATATNIATKKITKASLFEGMPRFAKLREGRYNLRVTKAGYARTLKQVKIDCAGLDEDGSVSETVILWEGSAEETMKMRDVTLTVQAMEKPPTTSPQFKSSESILQTPKLISAGVVNGKALLLVKPEYPPAAKVVRATGAVNVQVTIDEEGNVISASAISGHPLLRQAAEKAAKASTFTGTKLEGVPVKVTGIIVYNFVP